MKDNLSKVLRYFFMNKKVKRKEVKSLLLTFGIYIIVGICMGIVKGIFGRIPLIGNLLYHVAFLYKIYAWAGAILAIVQCFGQNEYSDITYVTFADVKNFINKIWNTRNGKIALIICVALLCLLPHTLKGKKVKNSSIENDSIVEIESNIEVEETETFETEINNNQNTEQFYSYVKGCYEGDEIYYTFSCLEGSYYYINSDSVGDKYTNDNYYIAIYSIDEFECAEDSFEATLIENGNTHAVKGKISDGKCTTLIFFDGSKEVTLTNTSLTSYDELLAQDYYKNCYLSAYYSNDNEDVFHKIEWFEYSKDDEIESFRYEVSSETDGDELVLKYKDKFSPKFIVLGIKDGVVIPLYERNSFGNEEVYDEASKTLWFFYDGGTSGGTGHFYLEYTPDRGSYRVIECTDEMEEKLAQLQLTPIEEMDLCDRLIYELAQTEGLPEGYSSALWDNMTFQFDGMTIEMGKTMFDELLASGNWEMSEFGEFDRANISYSTYESAPDYVTFMRDLDHKTCMRTGTKKYKDYVSNPLYIELKLYDVKDFNRDNSNKTVYQFEYNFFTYVPEEISNFPPLKLMGDVSYNTTYEEAYNIYGTPAWIHRGIGYQSCQFIYLSEDYTKYYSLQFDEEGKLKEVALVDYSWFQDKTEIVESMKESMVEGRAGNYEILQEKRARRTGL